MEEEKTLEYKLAVLARSILAMEGFVQSDEIQYHEKQVLRDIAANHPKGGG